MSDYQAHQHQVETKNDDGFVDVIATLAIMAIVVGSACFYLAGL